MTDIMEKFSWMTGIPELEQIPLKPNVVRIKGIAGKVDVISRNNRHYIEEELVRSARTWIGKPVTINHADYTDPKNKMGEVVWMELDKDGLLEYAADVWKQPYVGLLKNKSADVKGVSVEAGYLHNLCPKCNQKFFDETSYRDHMKTDHFMTIDPKLEPHGMVGQALSLVLAPEEPGIPGTTVELMETVNGFTKLCETIIKEKEEKQTMNKIKNPGVAIQETEKEKTVVSTTSTFKTSQTEANIPTQTEQKPLTQPQIEKKKDEIHTEMMKPTTEEKLAFGEPCSPKLRACVDALIVDGKEESSAWAICKSKLGETLTVKESKIGSVIWKPIAFEPFESILKETKDEIHAAQIVKQNREINDAFANITYTINEVITDLNTPIKVPLDDLGWRRIQPYNDAPLKETIANIPKDDTTWKEQIANQPKDDVTWKDKLVTIEKTGSDTLTKLTELEQRSHKELADLTLKTEAKFKEYDTIKDAVAIADKNVLEIKKGFDEKLTKLETENADLKKKLTETNVEVAKTKTIAETAKIDSENAIDKMKPEFKGKTKGITETAKTEPITETPTHKEK